MVCGEMGEIPFSLRVKCIIINYWSRLKGLAQAKIIKKSVI